MLRDGAAKGARDPKRTRRVLLVQHYPGRCAALKKIFMESAPEEGAALDFRCIFGHDHATTCEAGGKYLASGPGRDCKHLMIGAGGGCCSADAVSGGGDKGAGFAVLHFPKEGGFTIERVSLSWKCSIEPRRGNISRIIRESPQTPFVVTS